MLLFLFTIEGFGELLEDTSSFVGVSTSSRVIGFFLYCERLDALRDLYLAGLSRQDHAFAPLGPVDDRFRVVVARLVLEIPSFVSLAPPISSPYLDANEEIDLLATGSLGC